MRNSLHDRKGIKDDGDEGEGNAGVFFNAERIARGSAEVNGKTTKPRPRCSNVLVLVDEAECWV